MPDSRPLPSIARNAHELRIRDRDSTWRIVHRIDADAIVIVEVFSKKTAAMPKPLINACRKRLADYDAAEPKRP